MQDSSRQNLSDVRLLVSEEVIILVSILSGL